jgi:hypothetical protein
MTIEELNALSDDALNRLAAQHVMCWRPIGNAEPYADHFDAGGCISSWGPERFLPSNGRGSAPIGFRPSWNLEDAFALQAEIERRGLIDSFVRALSPTNNPLFAAVPLPKCNPSNVIDWCLANATARQRTIAAIVAVEGK